MAHVAEGMGQWEYSIKYLGRGKSTFPDPSGVHFSQAFIHPPIQPLCDSVRRKIEILRYRNILTKPKEVK